MGLLSLDHLKLRIKLVVGTPDEKAAAKKILPLIESHHFLLCTLLLFNAVSNEALPVFLDEIVPAWAAVVIAVTAVLLCGEILPTALFTGPNQLAIAARFSGLVYFLQFIFYPIAMPMSLALDKMLGDEDEENLNRDEISAMMQILRDNKASIQQQQTLTRFSTAAAASSGYDSDGGMSGESSVPGGTHNPMASRDSDAEDPLSTSEVNVITGVLALAKKTIRDVFVPLEKVNMLSSEQVLDVATMEAIDKVGHSRLPVFLGADHSHILGFLLVKRLITVNPEKGVPLSEVKLIQPIVVGANQSLLDVLNMFQTGHSHLALVSEDPEELQYHLLTNTPPKHGCGPIGILSIEDIFEEMIQSEIYDEEDIHKGHDQEHASLALREMSMRSSMSPSMGGFLDAKVKEDVEAAVRNSSVTSSPPTTVKPATAAATHGGTRRASGGNHPPTHPPSSTVEKKRQISVSIVESNTKANAGASRHDDGGFRRSNTMGYDRSTNNNSSSNARKANRSIASVVSHLQFIVITTLRLLTPPLSQMSDEDETIRERCLSASAGGPRSYLAAPSSATKITPSMVTKYIRRRKSAANLQGLQDMM